jgi:hypothetical protein
LVRPPPLVELKVAVPTDDGVKVTVTPVSLLSATVVGLKVPETPETDGVIRAVVSPLPVNVIVTGVPRTPVDALSADVYAVAGANGVVRGVPVEDEGSVTVAGVPSESVVTARK